MQHLSMLQKQRSVNAIKDSRDQYLASISKGKELVKQKRQKQRGKRKKTKKS